MHNPASNPSDTLAEELGTGRALLQLLKDEQDLLISADVDGLSKATEEKTRLVATMSELALHRHRKLAAVGHAASEAGMQDWLDTLPESGSGQQIRQNWTMLIELAQLAKELNRTNGMLIGQHMARTQNALHALQGGQQGEQLYGPNGQATGPGSGRKLVIG